MEWNSKVSILLVVMLLIGLASVREYIEGFQAKPEITTVNLDLSIYDLQINQVEGEMASYPLFLFGDTLEFNCINYAVEHLSNEISKIKDKKELNINYYGETTKITVVSIGNGEYSFMLNTTEYKGNDESVSRELLTYKTEPI